MTIATTKEKLREVKSILISQPKPAGKSPYLSLAEKHNIKVDFRQFIQVEGVTAKEFRKQRIDPLEFTAIIFTSKTAIDHFFRLADELRIRQSISQDTKYFCSSETIALYLQKFIEYRKRKVFYSKNKKTTLFDLFDKHKEKERFLFPCANIHKADIPDHLENNDFNYSKVIIYEVVSSDLSDLADIYYDMIVFFTPLGIKSLYDNFPDFKQKHTRLACYGNVTAKSIEDHDLRIDVRAPSPDFPSMTMAIDAYLKIANNK